MLASAITQAQFQILSNLERSGSAFSLLGALVIILTYSCFSQFRRFAINRIIFYASFGNVLTNVATLISRAAINPDDSINSNPTCQAQGFLIQMFMPADAYWATAMALNVFLTFSRNFGEEDLKRLEKYYFAACYGLPAVPAITYLFIHTADRGSMYGNATLWCWIAAKWENFRIITFYAPVWLAMLATITMYTIVWKKIYVKYRQLQDCKDYSRSQLETIPRDPFKTEVEPQVFITQSVVTESTSAADRSLPNSNSEMKAYKIEISAGNEAGLAPPQAKRKPSTPEANRAILSYTKVAATLFFFMFCTWVPSSANRVYSVVHPGEVLFSLEGFSALVLSLQGFWNAVIYAYTSRQAFRQLWIRVQERLGIRALAMKESYRNNARTRSVGGVKFYEDGESMADLQSRSPESETGSVEVV